MRTPILLTVLLAMFVGTAGVATAGERGWRQHHAFSHGGPKLHARDHHRAIAPGFRHHRGKHLEHRRGHRAAWKHRRHHDRRPAFGHFHRGGHFAIGRDRFGSSIRIIIGDRRGHGPKRHRHRWRH